MSIIRIPTRVKIVLFNMQQNKGSGVGTSSTAVCHEAVTSIVGVTLITNFKLIIKVLFHTVIPQTFPGLQQPWKALGFIS